MTYPLNNTNCDIRKIGFQITFRNGLTITESDFDLHSIGTECNQSTLLGTWNELQVQWVFDQKEPGLLVHIRLSGCTQRSVSSVAAVVAEYKPEAEY